MILIAVIVGYLLGIIPFIIPKILERREEYLEKRQNEIDCEKEKEIFDEWLNGAKTEESYNKVNQADIYQEYTTGKKVEKGD